MISEILNLHNTLEVSITHFKVLSNTTRPYVHRKVKVRYTVTRLDQTWVHWYTRFYLMEPTLTISEGMQLSVEMLSSGREHGENHDHA